MTITVRFHRWLPRTIQVNDVLYTLVPQRMGTRSWWMLRIDFKNWRRNRRWRVWP